MVIAAVVQTVLLLSHAANTAPPHGAMQLVYARPRAESNSSGVRSTSISTNTLLKACSACESLLLGLCRGVKDLSREFIAWERYYRGCAYAALNVNLAKEHQPHTAAARLSAADARIYEQDKWLREDWHDEYPNRTMRLLYFETCRDALREFALYYDCMVDVGLIKKVAEINGDAILVHQYMDSKQNSSLKWSRFTHAVRLYVTTNGDAIEKEIRARRIAPKNTSGSILDIQGIEGCMPGAIKSIFFDYMRVALAVNDEIVKLRSARANITNLYKAKCREHRLYRSAALTVADKKRYADEVIDERIPNLREVATNLLLDLESLLKKIRACKQELAQSLPQYDSPIRSGNKYKRITY
ncbi:hypothetical protein PAPHI01_2304 [Pancytospora philotis]|nr:hypothetical protein PAPHI01_2304 [Pancytospora philotis]